MSSNALTLARPYARAAFALARQHQRLAGWSQLLRFAATVSVDPSAHAVLVNPRLSAEDAVALLLPPGESDPNFREFLVVLADNRRLPLLPEIAGLYEELRDEEERVVKATVTSAVAIGVDELENIRSALKRRFGREVEVQTAIDPELIGGAVIDAGDVVIDGSIRGKLKRLQSALMH